MATFDFRILLETVEGNKTSYMSQSFVDTSVDLVLSASQVYNRITGSVSCSYQNSVQFSGSDFNTSFKFKDNNLLSSSLVGGRNTGSIDFDAKLDTYDRLLRYKFIGDNHPPKKIIEPRAHIKSIFAYSPSQNIAYIIPEYSVW